MAEYKPSIGLEIHAELKTRTKMFCDSLNDPEEKHPNVNVCPICMGHPGTLPVINLQAVEHVLKVGMSLGSQIQEHSKFDRKNYFYPDLPKGYQISQYDAPLCLGGALEFRLPDNEIRKVKIRRIHLEEDTGKLMHPAGTDYSLVDFNRAGVPLMELVTEPDMHSAQDARVFTQELQLLLRYLGVSQADMEKGQMRLEANISVGKGEELGTKVEVKNLNSFRALEEATDYEIGRQIGVLESGGKIKQETRGWDDVKKVTYSQRWKEEAQDYRYFPEPDLPPLNTTKFDMARMRTELPELPWEKRRRLREEYALSSKEAEILVVEPEFAEFFEQAVSELEAHDQDHEQKHKRDELVRLIYNYLVSDLKGLMAGQTAAVSVKDLRVQPEHVAHLAVLIHRGKISSRAAKDLLSEMLKTGRDPEALVREKGLEQVSDVHELEHIISQVIKQHPKAEEDYRAGKLNALQFLVGQVMARSKGRANPKVVEDVLKKLLGA